MSTTTSQTPVTGTAASTDVRDLVVVADPFGRPNPGLVTATVRAGACGVLDLPDLQVDPSASAALVTEVTRRVTQGFAIRTPHDRRAPHGGREGGGGPDLPSQVETVILSGPLPPDLSVAAWDDRRVLVEVVSPGEAEAAIAAGADGVIAKGCEGGGRVGDVEGFVLAQHVGRMGVPFWVQGGVGEHTAAAAIAAGAAGVVLDGQLALTREADLNDEVRAAVAAMDGSETRVIGGYRVYARPDLPAAGLPADTPAEAVIGQLGTDLRNELLPLGQEAAVASPLADRYATVGGVVQAVRAAVEDHLARAAEHPPLAPGAGIARGHGIRHPVAQGPMTRVSDRAELAAAVAEAGGLPFLALALMSGPDTRTLLDETAELLGDHPWGVGILGFVPSDVRDAQLEVIHDVRPPVALIAGGRPSQARPLEDAGIATYLHVPSPGLLDRFLRDGARRFVFEGRECGGHVGPRASLPLWEAQIGRLLAFENPDELDVLFAGGIHDACSAAMVAAMAAPLTSRGGRIGVLMGTAYLFTREAVASGAITSTYQKVARDCESTVLLETSPGHATRCVESAYVRAFANRKAELEAAGTPTEKLWAELESLNLGRLRVASKGLRRDAEQLVKVSAKTQRREGMYMIGQVATLRDELTTVADLHEQITTRSTAHLRDVAAQRASREESFSEPAEPRARPVDVAVVGMAGIFPGAADTEQYWANVVGDITCVTEVPASRWDPATFYDPDAAGKDTGRRTPSKWGGFLPSIPFDALAYGIPPRSLASIESVQLLALEVVARTLADAGYDRREFDRERTSVIFGAESGNDLSAAYGFRASFPHFLGQLPPELEEHLPALTEDSFPGVLANVIAGRVANRLDLGGVNYTVDAACAASLAALDTACKELVDGTSDMVLCGGTDVHNGINDYLLFASAHALSPSGRCRTFDADADGITLGEGVACVALKRLTDAERDGDRIYAVIEATAGSSDGRHLGLTAPRKEGQMRALTRAYQRAGIGPSTVGLVEAHGTGTVVGDRTELTTLTEIFTAGEAEARATVLGSVKSQIGHTKCTAGLAGFIKTARAVHAGVLPPTSGIRRPNDYYDATTSPFRFVDRAAPWPSAERRAAVSAFGFGGTNFHVVLRSHPDDDRPRHGLSHWPVELFLIRAGDATSATKRLADLRRTVDAIAADDRSGERHRLRDLARTVCELGTGPVQYALVADGVTDLAAKLTAAANGEAAEGLFRSRAGDLGTDAKIAFLHPGQGSQRPNMLADLFVAFPPLQSVLRAGEPWLDRLYPGKAFDETERRAQTKALTDTRVAQPVLGLAALAATRLLRNLGIEPDMAGGHSYGELVALATAGVIDEATLLELSEVRGQAMAAPARALGDDPGAMAAVDLPAEELLRRLPKDAVLANYNGPRQVVVSGPTATIEALVEELAAQRIAAKRLDVAAAFHSPLVAGASDMLAASLEQTEMSPPALPVWSNATATPYPTAPEQLDEMRARLATQLDRPVRFVQQIESMYEAGARIFVEAGPGRILTRMVDHILGDRPHLAVCCEVPGEPGLRRLLLTLAELAAAGAPVGTTFLFRGRAERLDLAGLPLPAPGWRVDGQLVSTHDGQPVPGGLRPADHIPEVTMTSRTTIDDVGRSNGPRPEPQGPPQPATGRDATVQEYLRTGQRIADNQRDVMLSYLGGPATPATADRPRRESLERLDAPSEDHVVAAAPLPPGSVPTEPAPASSPLDDSQGGRGNGSGPSGPRPLSDAELLTMVMGVVADRTGYPLDMLDPDLDLEADLSIDSIKRVEVIGELVDRVGLPGADARGGPDEAVIGELARLKTLRSVVSWIGERTNEPGDRITSAGAPPDHGDPPTAPGGTGTAREATPAPNANDGAPPVPDTARRYLVEEEPLRPALPVRSLDGQTLALVCDAWDGLDHLRDRLEQAGATIEMLPVHRGAPTWPVVEDVATRLATVDGVVHLGAADLHAPVDARDVFAMLAPAVTGRATTVVAASAPPSEPLSTTVSGVAGMMRCLALEMPDRQVRAVELPCDEASDVAARVLADEILEPTGPASVTYREGRRATRRVTSDIPTSAPGHDGALHRESVVVVTGGARGITARATVALARATSCRLELLGRSPLPGDEDPRTAAADGPALRHSLAELGEHRTPAEIEAACDRILAAREIRATLSELEELGCPAVYHQVDARDDGALVGALDEIRARHGHIDAIVHGAGVLDDRWARDKTDEGFDRVFGTKVDVARTLLDHLGTDVRLVVLFSSASGVFGHRGQVDYCAANDALDELARRFDGVEGRRVVSIDWGPWSDTGMISPEVGRDLARRGIGLIDPQEGVQAFLAEIGTDPGEAAQVVVMRAAPDALTDGETKGHSTPIGTPPSAPEPANGDVTLEALTTHG